MMGTLPTLFLILVFFPHGLQSCGVNMSSGELGQYVLALISCCEDTTNLMSNKRSTKGINLGTLLSSKLGREIKSIEMHKHPLTTYYQVALAVLALCKQGYAIQKGDIKIFAQAVMNNDLSYGGQFSVDTGAMAAMAFNCLQDSYKPTNTIEIALKKLTMQIFCAKHDCGTIGNIYSTGLAMQALIANCQFIPFPVWNCSNTQEKVEEKIQKGAFSNSEMASQILPPLLGKTYLQAGQEGCAGVMETQSKAEMSNDRMIAVVYTVTNATFCRNSCNHSVHLTVTKGISLFQIMEKAKEKNPDYFRFEYEKTSLGFFITSIAGVPSKAQKWTYWQFLNGMKPIPVGVEQYRPSNGEHIIAKLTKY
ncbi:transcobalamin-1-like isoform X2 [Stegostoma tigrinum]|uniref:transcobalamin-1-like isoform X2 n=1 Tax=Stegostoma tigrinum TaxID=3053191 RepID=UPI00286FEBE8|nr:transcobalamin-1-like isoform X2 [Stegostoma tigrinum]